MSQIPVYKIQIPEYNIKEFKELSGELHYTEFGTPVPVEYWENKPDFAAIAAPIVSWLREHFMGKRVGLRLLGSIEHAGKSVDDLVEVIKTLGHDRYDENRKGDRYENIENKKIELFVLEIEVGKELGDDGEEQVKHALDSFYTYPIQERGIPIKIDIGIVYNLDRLEPVAHQYKGREDEVKTDGYIFKNPDKKAEAIRSIFVLSGPARGA